MKKDFYVLVKNYELATKILAEIESAKGEIWSRPITHPFIETCLIPWNTDYLQECSGLINGLEKMKPDDVIKKGYNFGYHQGPFAQASRKIEEARYILQILPTALSQTNFPAARSLYYGFQSSIYSTREALKKASHMLGHPANQWWKDKEKYIRKSEPLVHFLHVDYNEDKHGSAIGTLRPRLFMYGYAGPGADVFSGEGAFRIENKDTSMERRVFLPNENSRMEIDIDCDYQTVNGISVAGLPFINKMEAVISFFEELIGEAKEKFCGLPRP